MYGSLLSVLMMGLIPVWDIQSSAPPLSHLITVAPPARLPSRAARLLAEEERLSASGVIVMDLQSGQTLYQKNSAVSRPMASLTKLMTALLIVEHHEMDELVTIPADIAPTFAGVSTDLPIGQQFTVGDLLSAMLIASSNDAAVVLARHHAGSVKNFALAMNERAKALGLRDTSYVNPVGFDAQDQDSSPRDIAWLSMFVLRKKEIKDRMSTPSAQIYSVGGVPVSLIHTHELLRQDTLVTAGKTGTTDGARQCLVSLVEHKGRSYVVVLLHSRDRYADMRTILRQFTADIAKN